MKRGWIWATIFLALAAAGSVTIVFIRKAASGHDEALFQEQLRLARSEGIPTTSAEYAALIKPARPEENAASFYRELRRAPKDHEPSTVALQIDLDVVFHPYPASEKAAKDRLAALEPRLDLMDKATKRPRCWFDRDWRNGPAVLMPEYAYMRAGAKAVLLRGSLEATEGHAQQAVANAQEAFQIAKHAGEEPQVIARSVRESIYWLVMRELCYWAFVHHDNALYLEALSEAIDELPKPDLKAEYSSCLIDVLYVIDQSATPAGRANLGLKEEDIPSLVNLLPVVAPDHPMARIVQARRDFWAALGGPQDQMANRIARANRDMYTGLMAYPIAGRVYDAFYGGTEEEVIPRRLPSFEARRQEYIAASRALAGGGKAKSIKTSDLPSPFDGKPLSYSFDGRQIVISVSGFKTNGKPQELKIPPDTLKSP